jgi:hypothetical protein
MGQPRRPAEAYILKDEYSSEAKEIPAAHIDAFQHMQVLRTDALISI